METPASKYSGAAHVEQASLEIVLLTLPRRQPDPNQVGADRGAAAGRSGCSRGSTRRAAGRTAPERTSRRPCRTLAYRGGVGSTRFVPQPTTPLRTIGHCQTAKYQYLTTTSGLGLFL